MENVIRLGIEDDKIYVIDRDRKFMRGAEDYNKIELIDGDQVWEGLAVVTVVSGKHYEMYEFERQITLRPEDTVGDVVKVRFFILTGETGFSTNEVEILVQGNQAELPLSGKEPILVKILEGVRQVLNKCEEIKEGGSFEEVEVLTGRVEELVSQVWRDVESCVNSLQEESRKTSEILNLLGENKGETVVQMLEDIRLKLEGKDAVGDQSDGENKEETTGEGNRGEDQI